MQNEQSVAFGSLERKLLSFLPPNLSVDGLYSSLRHGSLQRPIAWSYKNVALVPSWVPDKKVPGLMNPSLRMFSLLISEGGKGRLWDTCMEDISMVHGQSRLTHTLWDPSANHFATIDEKGKIVIWTNKRYLNAWLPAYMVVLFAPVVCCEWINPERMYVASKTDGTTKYEREKTGRPRNPMTLLVLTSDGQLTEIFKPAAGVYTHVSINLPRRSIIEDVTTSRITHGSMLSGVDGIHLITHHGDILPSTVNMYQIDLRFQPELVFRCEALAILHISNPLTGPGSIMTPGVMLHLKLLPPIATRPLSIAIALASMEENLNGENTYKCQVVVWDVAPKVMGFHPAFQGLSTRRNDAVSGQSSLTFVLLGERRFDGKFISTLNFVPKTRELLVGFSDGSVLGLESRFPGLSDSTQTLLEGFRLPKDETSAVAISPSPNGLYLLCSFLDGKISTIDTSETTGYDLDMETIIQYTVLALLNDIDYSDIVAVIVKAARISGDDQLPDRFLEGVFKSYEHIKGVEDSSMLEPFMPKASVMRRMLSLQLVLFQALPKKIVQYRLTNALLHLQSIGETLSGCCTSDPATLAAHLDPASNMILGQKPLAFDINSLWSLFPLCGWALDFCTILFRELLVFLEMRTPNPAGTTTSTSALLQGVLQGQSSHSLAVGSAMIPKPTLLSFLYHSRARNTLWNVLVLVEQFHQYIRIRDQLYQRVRHANSAIDGPSGPGQEKPNHTNSMSIPEAFAMKELHSLTLSQYVEAAFTRCPIKIGTIKPLLRELNSIGNQADVKSVNGGASTLLDRTASDHMIFIKGIPPFINNNSSLAQAKAELRTIVRKYPTLWDMNRLVFANIHWLDLEPADVLRPVSLSSDVSSKVSPRERTLAMHPARCRIDPVTALKTRGLGHGGTLSSTTGLSGRGPHSTLQHHISNVSTTSNISAGSRGSIDGQISGRTNTLPSKTYTDSPSELPQQLRQPSVSQPFTDGTSLMMNTVGSGSHGTVGGGSFDLGNSPVDPGSIWGIALDESDDDWEEARPSYNRIEAHVDSSEIIKSIWRNWTPALQAQQPSLPGYDHDDIGKDEDRIDAEPVPDDDVLLEDEGEEDEDRYSDEDMQDTALLYNGVRRDSKGGVGGAGVDVPNRSRRPSLATALTPSCQWLLQESQSITKRTRSEWTVFPILNDHRPYTGDITGSGQGGSGSGIGANSREMKNSHQLAWVGLRGHLTPLDLQPTENLSYIRSQADIEAQVRKRRFGVDPIRKVKKYKTTGNGRRCIRCHQVAMSNTNNRSVSGGPNNVRRPILPHQIGSTPTVIPDIAASTLWYHNYDRSCICGGMWLEL